MSTESNEYYLKNKERIIKNSKEWYNNNKEYVSERNKRFYQENKELIKARNKEWYENNKEKVRMRYEKDRFKVIERSRKWRLDNPDKYKEQVSRYQEKNRDMIIERKQIRRMSNTDETIAKLYKKQKGKCALTNLDMDLELDNIHIDHKIPLSRGGTFHELNLQLVHGIANLIKHNKLECEISVEDFQRMRDRILEQWDEQEEEQVYAQ